MWSSFPLPYLKLNNTLVVVHHAITMPYLVWFKLMRYLSGDYTISHDDVTKWKHFPRYWPFVRGIHRSPVNSPHKGQWRGALMFSLICAWINGWVNNREAGDLRRHRAHYDVIVMIQGAMANKWHQPHLEYLGISVDFCSDIVFYTSGMLAVSFIKCFCHRSCFGYGEYQHSIVQRIFLFQLGYLRKVGCSWYFVVISWHVSILGLNKCIPHFLISCKITFLDLGSSRLWYGP